MTTDQGEGRDWAVALVHGIGHTEPREMLTLVTDAVKYARPELEIDAETIVHDPVSWRAGPHEPRHEPTPQYVRHGRIGGSHVRFATAFWSDIALIGESLLSLIGSLALGGLGVRYFADVSTSGRSTPARALHLVLTAMIMLLAVLFLPIVLATLFLSTAALLGIYMFDGRSSFLWQVPFIALTSFAAAAAACRLGRTKLEGLSKERRLVRPVFNSLFWISLGASLVMLLDHQRGLWGYTATNGLIAAQLKKAMLWYGDISGNLNWIERVGLLDETSIYIGFLQLLQYLCGFGVIFLTALVLLLLAVNMVWKGSDLATRRSLLLGATSVITMWVLILLVLWPENLLTSAAINLYYDVKLADSNWQPKYSSWAFSLWELKFVRVPISDIKSFGGYLPLLWFDLFFFVFLIAAFGVAVLLRSWRESWRFLHRSPAPNHLDKFRTVGIGRKKPRGSRPRLVLSGFYQGAVVIFMLTISVTVLAHTLNFDEWIFKNIFHIPLTDRDQVPHELALRTSNVAIGVLIFLAVFLGVAHFIRQAVKLVLDVVNHFASPKQRFPVRRRIASRLKDTLEFLLKDGGQPHLVVICHSQGTVITFDTLFGYADRDGTWHDGLWERSIRPRVASLTVLTFGSPISHVYQHYFANLYPAFDTEPMLIAASRDDKIRWYNSYRIDDYIGTWIDPSLENFPVNVPMPIGGHTSYWKEDVFRRLFAEPGMERVLTDLTLPYEKDADLLAHLGAEQVQTP